MLVLKPSCIPPCFSGTVFCQNDVIIWREINLSKERSVMKLLVSLFSNCKVDVLRIK